MVIDSVRLVRTEAGLVASFDADADSLETMLSRVSPGQWVLYRRDGDVSAPRAPAGVLKSFTLARDANHASLIVRPFDTGDFGPLPVGAAPSWQNWDPFALRMIFGRERVELEFVRKEPAHA